MCDFTRCPFWYVNLRFCHSFASPIRLSPHLSCSPKLWMPACNKSYKNTWYLDTNSEQALISTSSTNLSVSTRDFSRSRDEQPTNRRGINSNMTKTTLIFENYWCLLSLIVVNTCIAMCGRFWGWLESAVEAFCIKSSIGATAFRLNSFVEVSKMKQRFLI